MPATCRITLRFSQISDSVEPNRSCSSVLGTLLIPDSFSPMGGANPRRTEGCESFCLYWRALQRSAWLALRQDMRCRSVPAATRSRTRQSPLTSWSKPRSMSCAAGATASTSTAGRDQAGIVAAMLGGRGLDGAASTDGWAGSTARRPAGSAVAASAPARAVAASATEPRHVKAAAPPCARACSSVAARRAKARACGTDRPFAARPAVAAKPPAEPARTAAERRAKAAGL
jgi:hypothetical protein